MFFLMNLGPLHKPLPKQQNAVSPINQNTGINLDIKENSPFQEGVYLRQSRDQISHSFKTQKDLRTL